MLWGVGGVQLTMYRLATRYVSEETIRYWGVVIRHYPLTFLAIPVEWVLRAYVWAFRR